MLKSISNFVQKETKFISNSIELDQLKSKQTSLLNNIEELKKKNETHKQLLQLSEDLKKQQNSLAEFLSRVEEKEPAILEAASEGAPLSFLLKDVIDKLKQKQKLYQSKLKELPGNEASLQEEAKLSAELEEVRAALKNVREKLKK